MTAWSLALVLLATTTLGLVAAFAAAAWQHRTSSQYRVALCRVAVRAQRPVRYERADDLGRLRRH